MIDLNISTTIEAPIKRVFDYISVPENDFRWQYGTLATAAITNVRNSMGTYFRSVGHLLGRRNLSTYEVTEYELNSKYGFKSLSGPLHLQTSYTFVMAEGGTRIHVSTRAHVVDFFRVNERLLEKKLKKQLKENLVMLKDLLEEQVASFEASPLAV